MSTATSATPRNGQRQSEPNARWVASGRGLLSLLSTTIRSQGRLLGSQKSDNSLSKWTKQKWRTRDGKKAKRKGGTARYLPDAAWKSMSKAEARATDRKKRAESQGQGVVPNTRKAKQQAGGHVSNHGSQTSQKRSQPLRRPWRKALGQEGWWADR